MVNGKIEKQSIRLQTAVTHVPQDEADLVQELTLLDRARNLVCTLHFSSHNFIPRERCFKYKAYTAWTSQVTTKTPQSPHAVYLTARCSFT